MQVQATGVAALPEIDDVAPLSAADDPCLEEIRAVLERHGALSRFGLVLLHEHFPLTDDEVLLETVDVENRRLTSEPVKLETAPAERAVETSWRLDAHSALTICRTMCYVDGRTGDHTKKVHSN